MDILAQLMNGRTEKTFGRTRSDLKSEKRTELA